MSDMLRESFMDGLRMSPQRLVTVHCAPNVESRGPGSAAAGRSRGLAQRPTVLFVGRDFARKGGDLLHSAFPDVRRRVPDGRS
jgi:glycosyltransferase involved in cell wall biosynthesis